MPKTAWAKHLYNAYNHVKNNDIIYDTCGEKFIGIASTVRFRCTAKSPGGVWLTNGVTISGNVEKKSENEWQIENKNSIQ